MREKLGECGRSLSRVCETIRLSSKMISDNRKEWREITERQEAVGLLLP